MKSSYLCQLSVLIVTYHGDDLLANCLASLHSSCSDHIEIVVVDNSANATTEQLVRQYANAKYIAAETNLGFAGGNNLGLPYCTRPFVLLLNNDTIVHDEPFSALIQYLEVHQNVAVVQGKMRLARQGDILDTCGSLLTPIGEAARLYKQAPISLALKSRPVFSVKGACMLFRKNLLVEYERGGCCFLFYNHFKSYYEDIDFCHRVWLSGHEVHFVDTPTIDHLQGCTSAKMDQKEIEAQSLANEEFSLATTLGFTLLMLRRLFRLALFLCAVLRGNKALVAIIHRANAINRDRKSDLRKMRKVLHRSRMLSEWAIFKKVGILPPLRYYYLLIRGSSTEIERMFWL